MQDDIAACARLVEAGDPDRFAATMAAPAAARPLLWPVYAFNLEIARAPWTASQPMIAEMRLQWWIDRLAGMGAGAEPLAHEVAGPLARLIAARGLDVAPLIAAAEARRWDCWDAPFADEADLWAYLDATAGGLMAAAGQALMPDARAGPVLRDIGAAQGLAALLRATAELRARGRAPLPDPTPQGIARLARDGLARLDRARARRGLVPDAALPAILPAWQAGPLLRQAMRAPERVPEGRLALSEFARRGRLLAVALSGRW
ncbi:squalene/phytoene synthase family protein [Frigidibacter oleivorans]|uniref:squalene/phytoene synthase family protein n=1 Tax=Frigidibacter oleivorans TaxID=2487129 RepID=UPI000F8E7DF0|nr:squalene/phytoene synthase family protein [Frigidibacter oleivorans]